MNTFLANTRKKVTARPVECLFNDVRDVTHWSFVLGATLIFSMINKRHSNDIISDFWQFQMMVAIRPLISTNMWINFRTRWLLTTVIVSHSTRCIYRGKMYMNISHTYRESSFPLNTKWQDHAHLNKGKSNRWAAFSVGVIHLLDRKSVV